MAKREAASAPSKTQRAFELGKYLDVAGPSRQVEDYRRGQTIFAQGDPGNDICYIQKGAVRLSVLSHTGKEAIVAMLGAGDFFGEGALAGQTIRLETATAAVATSVLIIEKAAMVRLLHDEAAFSDRFIAHMLARNVRIEADLLDLLFNSSEKRLARALLLLARYGQDKTPPAPLRPSQETLAEMVGTTRSRVNFFMNKFRKMGLIEYDRGGIKVNRGLMNLVLHD